MIYQVLSRPRTGSNKIYQYARHHSKEMCKWLSEYFNIHDSPEEYEEKFKFLEIEKDNGRHYCLKIQIGQIRDIPRVVNYFKDYHICITKRNPWDSYLSYMFCELHDWKISHKDLEGNWSSWTEEKGKINIEIDEDNFVLPVNEENIKKYIKSYKRDINVIEDMKPLLSNYTVFDYDNLDLKVLFDESITGYTVKNNIDYEAHIPFGLVDHYKATFDKYLNE